MKQKVLPAIKFYRFTKIFHHIILLLLIGLTGSMAYIHFCNKGNIENVPLLILSLTFFVSVNEFVYRYYRNCLYYVDSSENGYLFIYKGKKHTILKEDIKKIEPHDNYYKLTLKSGKKYMVMKDIDLSGFKMREISDFELKL